MTLIECVPNFSEGRRRAVIDALVAALASVEGAHVLNVHSDADHNRSVVTLAGAPEPVAEAAFRAIATASQLIDLDQHTGVHPRIGAADVVPFVPLRDVSMAECARLAQRLGERVAGELNLPVYLYEYAARRDDHRLLPDVRRHPYETLKTTIGSDPSRTPDLGPAVLGKAGAVIIGARDPLVALNAYLDSDDVAIARAIARRVRASSGGLPHVRALGVLVKGRAQVTMNALDFRRTALHVILDAVRAEAAQHGVRVTQTELVGLVPQAALIDAALVYLQLPPEARALVLEQQVGAMSSDYRQIAFE